jgi:ribosomal protein S4
MICGKDLATTSNLRGHFQTCNSRQITENIVLNHEQHQRELCEQREYYERQLCELREQHERTHKQEEDAFERSLDEYPWKLVRTMDSGESDI